MFVNRSQSFGSDRENYIPISPLEAHLMKKRGWFLQFMPVAELIALDMRSSDREVQLLSGQGIEEHRWQDPNLKGVFMVSRLSKKNRGLEGSVFAGGEVWKRDLEEVKAVSFQQSASRPGFIRLFGCLWSARLS